jgi:hypothetical protein
MNAPSALPLPIDAPQAFGALRAALHAAVAQDQQQQAEPRRPRPATLEPDPVPIFAATVVPDPVPVPAAPGPAPAPAPASAVSTVAGVTRRAQAPARRMRQALLALLLTLATGVAGWAAFAARGPVATRASVPVAVAPARGTHALAIAVLHRELTKTLPMQTAAPSVPATPASTSTQAPFAPASAASSMPPPRVDISQGGCSAALVALALCKLQPAAPVTPPSR